MNKLVFVYQKTRKLFGPQHFAELFSGAMFFRKVFLPQIVLNCPKIILRKCSGWSCEFEIESHSSIVIINLFFGLQTGRIIFPFLAPSSLVFTMFQYPVVTVKTCQILSDYWPFA